MLNRSTRPGFAGAFFVCYWLASGLPIAYNIGFRRENMTLALGSLIILVFVFVAGISLGVVFTLIALSGRRTITVQSPGDPPLVSDSTNPYEPSNITSRVVRSGTGCGVVGIVLAILAGLMLAAILVFVSLRTSVVPATVQTPPPVLQPQPPPSNPAPAFSP